MEEDSGQKMDKLDWREVLSFVESQTDRERGYFDRLYRFTLASLGVIVSLAFGLIVFMGVRTVSDIRDQARVATESEIAAMRKQVALRIDAEFSKHSIEATVAQAAKSTVQKAIMSAMAAEIAKQVEAAKPAIAAAVRTEVAAKLTAIERRTAPRALSAVHRQLIVNRLSGFAGRRIRVNQLAEQEPRQYSEQLAAALRDAGWQVEVHQFTSSLGEPRYGIYCGGPEETSPAMKTLAEVLGHIGNPVVVQHSNDSFHWITVFLKPDR